MKILIHSNGPMVPSGYGKQVRLLAPRLKAAGHDVAVSAFYGLSGSAITWEGIPILPAGQAPYGTDVLVEHAENYGADVVITLMDFWKLAPVADRLRDLRVLAWLPVDCTPLGRPDRDTLLRSGAQPVAMSRFGQNELQTAGFSPAYAPHMVDTAVFKPPADRRALRRELGVDEFFLVGICAANSDGIRKAWPEQFRAFAEFSRGEPDARLMVHSRARSAGGVPLDELAEALGIGDKILWSDQYALNVGLMDDSVMADWYGCLDVLSACSYAEGFGVPIVEAQACGVPVVSTDVSAMPEVTAYHTVPSDPWWNPVHRAWWGRPSVEEIVLGYRDARHDMRSGSAYLEQEIVDQVTYASVYDADHVVSQHWLPLLEGVEDRRAETAADQDLADVGQFGSER